MSPQIINQATLKYRSGSKDFLAASNTASVTMNAQFNVTKDSLQDDYQIGKNITYNVFITNISEDVLTNLTITDDLGAYTFSTQMYTPLTYIGPAKAFIDNISATSLTVVPTENTVSFIIPELPAGKALLLQYDVLVNEYARAVLGESTIVNTVSVSADGVADTMTASNTLPIAAYADVSIEKTMYQDPAAAENTLVYTFHVLNYGTIEATNVTLEDTFFPIPTKLTVMIDSVTLSEEDYSYVDGTFTYPPSYVSTNPYKIRAASFTQNEATGIVHITPGSSTIVIRGTI